MAHTERVAIMNNAGVMTPGPLAEADDEQFERHPVANVRGTINGLREGEVGRMAGMTPLGRIG